jgi:hypothetical protein
MAFEEQKDDKTRKLLLFSDKRWEKIGQSIETFIVAIKPGIESCIESRETSLDLCALVAMFKNLRRYPMPLDSFMVIISLLVSISAVIVGTLNFLCGAIIQSLVSTVMHLLVGLYTGGKGITSRLNEYMYQHEKYIIDSLMLSSSPTTYLKLLILSIYDTLTQWPEDIIAVLLWPLRFVTAVPLLLLATAGNFITFLLDITFMTLSETLLLGILGVLFALNIPLILRDTSSYLIRKIKNCCCAPKPNSAGEDEPLLISSQRRMSAALSSTQSPRSPSPPSSPRQQETSLHGEGLRENGNNGSSFNWQGPPLNLEGPSLATESPDRKQSPSLRGSVDRMD